MMFRKLRDILVMAASAIAIILFIRQPVADAASSVLAWLGSQDESVVSRAVPVIAVGVSTSLLWFGFFLFARDIVRTMRTMARAHNAYVEETEEFKERTIEALLAISDSISKEAARSWEHDKFAHKHMEEVQSILQRLLTHTHMDHDQPPSDDK